MKTQDLFLGIITIGVIFIALGVSFPKSDINFGAYSEDAYYAKDSQNYSNASTTSGGSFWASTTAFSIARNNNRSFFRATLDKAATSSVFITQGTSTDLTYINEGIYLNVLTTSTPNFYQIDRTNPYRGELQFISDGNAKVYWIEN